MGALGKPLCAHIAEHLVGGSQLLTRVDAAALATQPFAVHEPGAGEVDDTTAARQAIHRVQEMHLALAVQHRLAFLGDRQGWVFLGQPMQRA